MSYAQTISPGAQQTSVFQSIDAESLNLSAQPAIEFDKVSLRFISADGTATLALRNFSMQVARGEFIAIVGPTGSGKSTTLNLITGLLKATVGQVRVMGQPWTGSIRA